MDINRIFVTFDFRDWKWLSNFIRFQAIVEDKEVILGRKEGSLMIDFSQMQ